MTPPLPADLKFLPQIGSPADLRNLPPDSLRQVAREMRAVILDTVFRQGGHLGASLGAIELTLALHYCFDTPRDQVVFDTGHQGYGHKLLTGRLDRFHTIRQPGGLSGFLKRTESEYDVFGAGHASTAISAALGIAHARDTVGDDYRVAAVIGDGAMTGGLAFEALNNAGQRPDTNFLVVLNDNNMSISPPTGALSRYFAKIVTTSFYNERKHDIHEFVQSLPYGEGLTRAVRRMEGSLKHLLLPNQFFEDLGFRYIGPVDGHNLDLIIPLLQRVRDLKGPVIFHCKTVKGKGLSEAERDQLWGHAPSVSKPVVVVRKGDEFEIEVAEEEDCLQPAAAKAAPAPAPDEKPKPKPKSYTKVFAETLIDLAEADEKIVAITAAMPTGTGLDAFERRFPERFYDVGIAEEHAVCSAAGMAIGGLKPVVAIYSTFLQRAFDQIMHDVALQHLPVIFALDRAGLVGADGPTHHGAYDLSYLRCIPEIVIMAPTDEAELRQMLYTATRYEAGPTAIRYPRGSGIGADMTGGLKEMEIGRSVTVREGADTAILAVGNMLTNALEAADLLAERGVEAAVINPRFVKPLDVEMIDRLAGEHDLIFSVEDNSVRGGFGSAVNETLVERGHYRTSNIVLGLPDSFVDHGTQEGLHAQLGLDAKGIADRVFDALKHRARRSPSATDSGVRRGPVEARAPIARSN